MVKIAYDAGHGINTPGKRSPDGEREWTFNNHVVLGFQAELLRYKDVELLRTDDSTGRTDVSLKSRTDKANNWKADYYISFHHNANTSKWGAWTGVETFTYTGVQTKSTALAKALHPALVKGYGLRDRGIKQANFHIVRETKMPAILLEGGFMDSTTDIRVLRNSNKLERAGKLIAQALASHLKLQLKTSKPVEIAKPTQIKPEGDKNMKMSELLTASQMKQLEDAYKKAFEKGLLNSDEWHKKVANKSIMLHEVAYLNAVLWDRSN